MILQKLLLGAFLAGMVSGCAHFPPADVSASQPGNTKQIELRNNAASLLADLLNDEKNVDKVLLVKSASSDVTELIKLIAATAAANDRELSALATNDSALNLAVMALPPGEQATRDATAKSKEHDLLFSTGVKFEFNLLYSQAEAENYGWHLAEVAAENSKRPEQIRTFTNISQAMKNLYNQSVTELFEVPGR